MTLGLEIVWEGLRWMFEIRMIASVVATDEPIMRLADLDELPPRKPPNQAIVVGVLEVFASSSERDRAYGMSLVLSYVAIFFGFADIPLPRQVSRSIKQKKQHQ